MSPFLALLIDDGLGGASILFDGWTLETIYGYMLLTLGPMTGIILAFLSLVAMSWAFEVFWAFVNGLLAPASAESALTHREPKLLSILRGSGEPPEVSDAYSGPAETYSSSSDSSGGSSAPAGVRMFEEARRRRSARS